MTSLLCTKSLEGSVQIHDQAFAEELQIIKEDDALRTTFMPRSKKKSFHRIVSPVSCGSDDSYALLEASSLKGKALLSGAQAKEIKTEMKKENDSAQSLYGPLLAAEKTFVQDVNQYLNQWDTLSLRKKELLHKTWSSGVYEPMRRKILEVVNSKEFAHKDRRHRELYRQYLEYTNKKGFVFLDTMDKGEYYAQSMNGHRPAPITVKTASLQDPLLLQGRERSQEDQTILRCTTGEVYSLSDIEQIKLPPLPLVPLGRHSTNCMTWMEMPLGNIVSTPRQASRLRMKGNCTQSQIKFAHTPRTSIDTTVIDRELKSQKKRMFVNTPPFDRPPKPVLKPPFACCSELNTEGTMMCPVSA